MKQKFVRMIPWVFLLFMLPIDALCQSLASAAGSSKQQSELIPHSSVKQALDAYQEGLAMFDLGNNLKARMLFTKAIEADPNMGIAYLMRANTASTAKEFKQDIMKGKENMKDANDWEKLYSEYMFSNLTSEVSLGLDALKKITTIYPYAARGYYDLGFAYAANNQFSRSREAFQKAAELNPGWAGGFSGLSNSYLFYDPKDLKKAEEYALKVAEIQPKSAGSHVLLGDVYRAMNDMVKAREAYARSVDLDPMDPTGFYKLGHVNVYLGNFDEAGKNYADAGSKDVRPTYSESLQAFTFLNKGDHAQAIKMLIEAASRHEKMSGDPHIIQTDRLELLSAAYDVAAHTGDVSTMKDLLPIVSDLNKQVNNVIETKEAMINAEAFTLERKAEFALAMGNLKEANDLTDKIKSTLTPLKDDRKLEAYHMLKGKINLKEQKFSEAASHFKKANPLSMLTKYHLAKALEGMGKTEKAKVLYQEIADYNFNNIDNALVRHEVKTKLKM